MRLQLEQYHRSADFYDAIDSGGKRRFVRLVSLAGSTDYDRQALLGKTVEAGQVFPWIEMAANVTLVGER